MLPSDLAVFFVVPLGDRVQPELAGGPLAHVNHCPYIDQREAGSLQSQTQCLLRQIGIAASTRNAFPASLLEGVVQNRRVSLPLLQSYIVQQKR